MTVWAVAVVRDEADVLATTLEHLVGQVDGIAIADNGSCDETAEIARRFGVRYVYAPGPFIQSERMTALAHLVGEECGAEWVVPFDADEIWWSPHGPLRDVLPGLPANVVTAPFYNHYPTAMDPTVGAPFDRLPWRWSGPHGWKQAARYTPSLRIGRGSHLVSHPAPVENFTSVRIHHFPWRSLAHYEKKTERGKRVPDSLWARLAKQGVGGFDQFFFCSPGEIRSGWPPGTLIYDPWRVIN